MKIFVTGGTGFIGSQLVSCLAETDHQLVCLARKTSDIRPLQEAGATIVYGDLLDKASLLHGMQGCDWLAHVAGNYSLWEPDYGVYRQVNVQGVRNVMESALEVGIKKIVHVSSLIIFGNAAWPIKEDSSLGPSVPSEYARTKRAGEEVAWQLYREEDLPLIVVYPSCVLGSNDPKASGRYFRSMAEHRMPSQMLVDKHFSFVYVNDVCTAIQRALEKENNIGEKYLVSGANMTWGEVNKMICEIAGVPLPSMTMPTPVARLSAHMMTALANLTKKSPWMDLAVDQFEEMAQGFSADGSKAERELEFKYTPIRQAFEEEVNGLKPAAL